MLNAFYPALPLILCWEWKVTCFKRHNIHLLSTTLPSHHPIKLQFIKENKWCFANFFGPGGPLKILECLR